MGQGARSQNAQAVPRVLVIRGGAIGDFILTLPAVRLIKECIPGCEVEVLGYPGIVDLAVKAGLAARVRSLEHRSMAPLFARQCPIDESLAAHLRSFNLVVSYLYDPDGLFRASLERIGVKTLIECPHRVEAGKGHAAVQLARPLERLAMFVEDSEWRRPLFPQGSAPARRGRRVVMHPGSGSEKKNWPVANWVRLGREIAERWPAWELVLATGEAEAERGVTQTFREAWAEVPHAHWDGLPLTELALRMADSDLFLGHDSGTGHLAAASGVDCRLLFGPTDPDIWAPPQAGVRVVRAPAGDLAELGYEVVWQVVIEAIDRE